MCAEPCPGCEMRCERGTDGDVTARGGRMHLRVTHARISGRGAIFGPAVFLAAAECGWNWRVAKRPTEPRIGKAPKETDKQKSRARNSMFVYLFQRRIMEISRWARCGVQRTERVRREAWSARWWRLRESEENFSFSKFCVSEFPNK